jgi:hypothetical protein
MILIRTGGKGVGMGSPERRGTHNKKAMCAFYSKIFQFTKISFLAK